MKNGFTPLDDIRNQMDMYGANGTELLNAEALDESVSNLVCEDYNYGFMGMGMGWANYKGKVKAIVKAPKVVKTDKGYFRQGFFPKGTEKNVVDFQKITFYCPFLKRNVTKMMLIFDDGTASIHRRWDKISKFSGFTNESLLDGLTENTSLLNATGGNSMKVTNGNKVVRKFDWSRNVSLPAFARKLCSGRRCLVKYGSFTLNTVKDVIGLIKNKPLLLPQLQKIEYKDFYEFSDGTYGLVSDWFPTEDKAENQNYSNLTNESLLDEITENTSLLSVNGETETKKEVKILGMTPTTFGMVAGGAILVIGIVALTIKK